MDPLASVKEFRQQGTGPGRTVKVAPPPPLPAAPAPTATPPESDDADLAPTGEFDLTERPAHAAPEIEDRTPDGAAADAEDTIGMARGRKRLIHVYLPGPTRERLEVGRQQHGTLGVAVMAALRGSYQWIVEHHTPEPAEPVGPFPAPTPPRRRLAVHDARLTPFYVNPDEARAIDQLADELQLSVSELVTIAIDRYYPHTAGSKGGRPSPAPTRVGT